MEILRFDLSKRCGPFKILNASATARITVDTQRINTEAIRRPTRRPVRTIEHYIKKFYTSR